MINKNHELFSYFCSFFQFHSKIYNDSICLPLFFGAHANNVKHKKYMREEIREWNKQKWLRFLLMSALCCVQSKINSKNGCLGVQPKSEKTQLAVDKWWADKKTACNRAIFMEKYFTSLCWRVISINHRHSSAKRVSPRGIIQLPFSHFTQTFHFGALIHQCSQSQVNLSSIVRCPHFWTNERLDKHTFGQMNVWTNSLLDKWTIGQIDIILKIR